jgi:hypothetical protein
MMKKRQPSVKGRQDGYVFCILNRGQIGLEVGMQVGVGWGDCRCVTQRPVKPSQPNIRLT